MAIKFSSGSQKDVQDKQAKKSVVKKTAVDEAVIHQAVSKPVSKAVSNSDSKTGLNAMPSALLKKTETPIDQTLDLSIRPKVLDEYVGQSHLKSNLNISIEAAKQRDEALDHLLFYGPPGLGKTTLAMVIAEEMGANIHITAAPALERPRDIIGILMSLKPGTVLFIDEIHRLNKVTEEILYPAMEDYRLDRTIGKGESTKILSVPLPRFTLVGATTKAGSISGPLRDRFGLVMRLNFYTEEELVDIVLRTAGILEMTVTPEGAHAIGRRSRGTPRIANRLLRRVRDFADVKLKVKQKGKAAVIDETLAEEALNLFEVDHLGLDNADRQLLSTMIENFNGGPVGLETLASAIGEDARTIEDVCEPFLLQSGLIHRTPRGRVASVKAYQHLNIHCPHDHSFQQTLGMDV